MATTTIRPNGAGHLSGHTPVGDPATWKCIDETTSDGDTTYIRIDSGSPDVDFSTLGNPSLPSGSTINSVTFYVVARALQNGDSVVVSCYTGGSEADVITMSLSTSYSTYNSGALTTNPSNGNPWTSGDLSALEMGFYVGSVTIRAYITQAYAVIDYTPPLARAWGQIMG